MPNITVPDTISVVTVDGREDGIYAFRSEGEAERFLDAVEAAGGSGVHTSVPLNGTPDHTDDLIADESDA
jgi:hypothetical protein